MNWLQAALAFSLMMLVLATIVTLILETGYRLLATRERGFRLMLERLFDDVLKPRVAHLLHGITVEQAREHFLQTVTHNQAYDTKPNAVVSLAQPGDLASMTMMQLADRLADTEVGKAIARAGADHAAVIINDLSQKFERFGQGASLRFKDQARFWCVLVSCVLAFVANVDAVRVFQGLLHDDVLTSRVIEQYGSLIEDDKSRPVDIKGSLDNIDRLLTDRAISEDAANQAKANLARAQLELTALKDTGLPITIEYWPFCAGVIGKTGRGNDAQDSTAATEQGDKAVDRKCDTVTDLGHWSDGSNGWSLVVKRAWSWQGLAWFLSVLLAGILIGLGTPFWFDLARKLARSAQILKAADANKNEAATPPSGAGTAPPPRTPVEAFAVAIAASKPSRARAVLSAAGRPLRGA